MKQKDNDISMLQPIPIPTPQQGNKKYLLIILCVRLFVCLCIAYTLYWNFFLLFSAININLESLHSVKLCLLRDDKTSRAVYEKQSHHVMYTRECTVHCTVVHRHKFCVKHHVIFTVMYELTLFRKKKYQTNLL